MNAKFVLQDLIEDPKNNGQYKLSIDGDELWRLWMAIDQSELELNNLRNAVFNLCGHLPGVSQVEQLAHVKAEIGDLKRAIAEHHNAKYHNEGSAMFDAANGTTCLACAAIAQQKSQLVP